MKKGKDGLLYLLITTICYGIFPILVKAIGQELTISFQFGLVFGLSAIAYLVFFGSEILSQLRKISQKDLFLAILRGGLYYGLGTGLYAIAVRYTSIANLTFFQVLPIIPLFGLLFLKEKLSWRSAFVVLSFLGALLMLFDLTTFSIKFDFGAFLSLTSAFIFSFALLARKWQSNVLSDRLLAFLMLSTGSLVNIVFFAFTIGTQNLNINTNIVLLLIFNISLNILASYSYNRAFNTVDAQTAGLVLNFEPVIASIIAFFVYQEVLSITQLLGACVIMGSFFLSSQIKSSN